jgi:hypothetical protein
MEEYSVERISGLVPGNSGPDLELDLGGRPFDLRFCMQFRDAFDVRGGAGAPRLLDCFAMHPTKLDPLPSSHPRNIIRISRIDLLRAT